MRKRIWGWAIVGTMVGTQMRDKHYKIRHIRLDDKTWETLKIHRIKSGKTWNLYLLELLKRNK